MVTATRTWFEIKNAAGADTELLIYDEIGEWALSAKEFVTALDRVQGRKLTVRIHSPGGDPFSAVAIYNALLRREGAVTTIADSLAASAASVVFMAGSRRLMARHSTLMVHDSSGLAAGSAATMEKMREMLAQIDDTIAGVYASRTSRPASFWRQEMANETWYDTDSAIAVGLAHEVATPTSASLASAGRAFSLAKYRHPPGWAQAAPPPRPAPRIDYAQARADAETHASLVKNFGVAGADKAMAGIRAARQTKTQGSDPRAVRAAEDAVAAQMGTTRLLNERRQREGSRT